MESLNRDLGSLAMNDSKRKGGSFLDIVGADVDSSFDKPITVQVVQDTYHISVGGQMPVNENANIQIQIDDDNCLHYLHKYAIVADLYVTSTDEITDLGTIENGAMIFDGSEMSIGSVTWATSFQKYYAQQKLSKLGKRKMEYVDNGLALKHSNFAQHLSEDYNIRYLTAAAAVGTMNEYVNYLRQLREHYLFRMEQDEANHHRVKIVVPLPCIFPALWELPDDGCIYTGLGQKLKFNIRTVPATDCVFSNNGGAVAYHLKNVQLIRFYTKLDPIRSDLILKSSVVLPQLKYIHWQQSVLQSPINAIFGISAKYRLKGLIFGFHTTTQAAQTAEASVTYANLTNNTAAQFKYPLGYFPQLPIQQIDIDIGGHTYSITMNQLQIMHLSNYFGDQKETYDFPLQRSMKYAYYLDLTRFGFDEDLYGSSSKNITSVHIQINFKVGAGSKTLPNQAIDWDSTSLGYFGFYGFLETQQMFECRSGIYSTA